MSFSGPVFRSVLANLSFYFCCVLVVCTSFLTVHLSDIARLTKSLARSTSACNSEHEAHVETVRRAGRSKSLR